MIVENDKIRVRIDDAYWKQVVAEVGDRRQVLPSGDIRVEPAASVARGRILSDAMARLQYRAERDSAAAAAPDLDPARVREYARRILVTRWLGENARHRGTLYRHVFGHRLSTGQAMDVAEAEAWADGCLGLSDSVVARCADEVRQSVERGETDRAVNRQQRLAQVARDASTDIGEEALREAAQVIIDAYNDNLAYYTARAGTDDLMTIEIKEIPA